MFVSISYVIGCDGGALNSTPTPSVMIVSKRLNYRRNSSASW